MGLTSGLPMGAKYRLPETGVQAIQLSPCFAGLAAYSYTAFGCWLLFEHAIVPWVFRLPVSSMSHVMFPRITSLLCRVCSYAAHSAIVDLVDTQRIQAEQHAPHDVDLLIVVEGRAVCDQAPDVLARCRVGNDPDAAH